ncbi:histidine phosphatase superfamily [Haematococcus lacustris]
MQSGTSLRTPATTTLCRSHRRSQGARNAALGNGVDVTQLHQTVLAQQAQLELQARQIAELRAELRARQAVLQPAPRPGWNPSVSPFEAQRVAIGDRRLLGLFDARFHSTARGATPKDLRVLPDRIILVRHAESEGNVDNLAYSYIPDSQVPLTERGKQQAREAGAKIRKLLEAQGHDYKLFFYTSPYKRSLQTYAGISSAFEKQHIIGVQEEVQLREQDFGNFQSDPEGKQREKGERLRFGRFYYRFPEGESGADVYDRLTLFEDHLIRDINAGRYSNNTNLVLVTHGLALRIFLMRWFHWSVDEFLCVYNPPNAEPLVMERMPNQYEAAPDGSVAWVHTKALYQLSQESQVVLRGCTADMCSTGPAVSSASSKGPAPAQAEPGVRVSLMTQDAGSHQAGQGQRLPQGAASA